jgi:hypothetical protein
MPSFEDKIMVIEVPFRVSLLRRGKSAPIVATIEKWPGKFSYISHIT